MHTMSSVLFPSLKAVCLTEKARENDWRIKCQGQTLGVHFRELLLSQNDDHWWPSLGLQSLRFYVAGYNYIGWEVLLVLFFFCFYKVRGHAHDNSGYLHSPQPLVTALHYTYWLTRRRSISAVSISSRKGSDSIPDIPGWMPQSNWNKEGNMLLNVKTILHMELLTTCRFKYNLQFSTFLTIKIMENKHYTWLMNVSI